MMINNVIIMRTKETCCGFQFGSKDQQQSPDLTPSCHFFSQDFCIPKTQHSFQMYYLLKLSLAQSRFVAGCCSIVFSSNCLFSPTQGAGNLDQLLKKHRSLATQKSQKDNADPFVIIFSQHTIISRFFPFVNSSTFFFRFECQIMAFLYHYARFARAEKIDRNASSPMNGTGNKSKKGPD